MNEYIKKWNDIVINCSYDNTYKMAWGRAIVELCIENSSQDDIIKFHFKSIAEKCLKYYWNQTIYFDLIQGSNLNKKPEILSITKELIDKYSLTKNDNNPERFEKAENKIDKVSLENAINRISKVLKQDVSWRFMNINKLKHEIYLLDDKRENIIMTLENINILKSYSDLLFQLINYRWTQMLECFNHSPRISMKVKASGENRDIRRDNLSKFHPYLESEYNDNKHYCFFCGKEIEKTELSVDHIIPWSFMFSDDIWNLVFCHKSENSSKSNSIVSEEIIEKLEKRNTLLLEKLEKSGKKDKKFDELKLAIEHNYVRKFWISSKG